MIGRPRSIVASALALAALTTWSATANASSTLASSTLAEIEKAWPNTEVAAAELKPAELVVYGPRHTPPPLDGPTFLPVDWAKHVAGLEPMITVEIGGEVRAYPMRIVASHAIINDEVGGVPIAVTYCRVCSAAMVFKRVVDGQVTRLSSTGVRYENNSVYFDTETETWWQQINGMALAGNQKGGALEIVPSKIESFAKFRTRHAGNSGVLVLNDSQRSTDTPLQARLNLPQPHGQGLPAGVDPLDRAVIVGDRAFTLELLRQEKRIEADDLVILWEPGRQAGPDAFAAGADEDVGNVTVYRRPAGDERRDLEADLTEQAYRVNLVHAFRDFTEKGEINFIPLSPPREEDDPTR